MKILVIGGTGFIGLELSKQLEGAGHNITLFLDIAKIRRELGYKEGHTAEQHLLEIIRSQADYRFPEDPI